MTISLPNSAARTLALSEIQHNPDEMYDDFTFSGEDIGLPSGEYVVIKYFRRTVKSSRDLTKPPFKALEALVVAGVTGYETV